MNPESINKLSFEHKGVAIVNEDVLIIECSNCSNYDCNFFQDICVTCLCFKLSKYIKKKIREVYLKSFEINIDYEIISLFFEYFSYLGKIRELLKKIIKLRKDCLYSDFKCLIIEDYILSLHKSIDLFNPILIYKRLQNYASNIKEITISFNCKKCYNRILQIMNELIQILSRISIIKSFNNYSKKRNLFKCYNNFYEFLFSNSMIISEKLSNSNHSINKTNLIEQYDIGKNKIYTVSIYNRKHEIEQLYDIKPFYADSSKEDFFEKIINYAHDKMTLIKINQIISLEDLITAYKYKAIKIIDQGFNINKLNKKRLGLLTALKILNLEKIFPLLLDDKIEEIFLDSPKDFFYINHQEYYRCRTLFEFNKEEIQRIKTMLRLYSGNRLDRSNPSLQHVIKNNYFYCRFAIDISPINFNDFSLDIRKLNKNIYTIQDLIKNGTLSSKIAAFLYFCVLNRFNITVTGETDSGKTTLINAFDLITPKELRKIYVENVIESLNETQFNRHQLKFRVNSSVNGNIDSTKSGQIKTLLHRSPDLIFLGEILTKEESEAMFHCLSAGLKGFQTVHANSIKSLINRLIYHFNIKQPCLNDLDLIIMMKKGKNANRKIISIAEVNFNNDKGISIKSIFKYNPKTGNWDLKYPLYETKVIKKILNYEDLPKERFNSLIELYVSFFEKLSSLEKVNTGKLIDLFDKISFFSRKSLDLLYSFLNGIDL